MKELSKKFYEFDLDMDVFEEKKTNSEKIIRKIINKMIKITNKELKSLKVMSLHETLKKK